MDNAADTVLNTVLNTIRIGLGFLLIITITIIVQSIANRIMKSLSDSLDWVYFPQKLTILMILLLYILFIAILIDLLVWTAALMAVGLFTDFLTAFAFSTNNFTTLGGGAGVSLGPPYEFVGPVMSINGIVMIAFGVSCMYSILYKS